MAGRSKRVQSSSKPIGIADTTLGPIIRAIGERGAAFIGAAGVVLVLVWTLYTFFWTNTRHASDEYYDYSLKQCHEVAELVGKIAATNSKEEIRRYRPDFYRYYYGTLVVVEDGALESAMVKMGRSIETALGEPKSDDASSKPLSLQNAALRVSKACHDLVRPGLISQVKSWSFPTQKISKEGGS
jgi:hypothetical protein